MQNTLLTQFVKACEHLSNGGFALFEYDVYLLGMAYFGWTRRQFKTHISQLVEDGVIRLEKKANKYNTSEWDVIVFN